MDITTIIPSFHSPDLDEICIRSIERFKPKGWNVRHVVVENSDDHSFKQRIMCLGAVEWVQNPTEQREASANAVAIRDGLRLLNTNWALILHCDTCVVSPMFFTALERATKSGMKLVGTQYYPPKGKPNCYHCSGIFAHKSVLRKADYTKKSVDAADDITAYCRREKITRHCFQNTLNDSSLVNSLPEPYKSFHVDRCIMGGEVAFLHLGRGIPKTRGTYSKPGRVYLKEWVNFCRERIA